MIHRIAVVTFALLVPPAVAENPEAPAATGAAVEEQGEVRALVSRLGEASFADREEATRRLVALGAEALPVLREASESPNLEVRYRSRRVVDAILENEHESRLQAFLDADELADDALPGWGRYRDTVGDGDEAKQLFVEMQRSERRLFESVLGGDREATAAFAARCVEIQNRYSYGGTRRVPMGSLAAAIFLAGDESLELDAQTKARVSAFCNYNDFQGQITSGDRVDLARRVLGVWIARPDEKDPSQLYMRVRYAMQYGVEEGIVPARKLLAQKQINYQTQYGLLGLGRFGGEKELAEVEQLMDNKTVLSQSRVKNKVAYTCQVRDVALAVAVKMREGDVAEYDFARLREHPQYLIMPNSAGFESEEKREAAFAKYTKAFPGATVNEDDTADGE